MSDICSHAGHEKHISIHTKKKLEIEILRIFTHTYIIYMYIYALIINIYHVAHYLLQF